MTNSNTLTVPSVQPEDANPIASEAYKPGQTPDISVTKPDEDRTDQDKNHYPSTLNCPEMSAFLEDPQTSQLSRRQIQALPYLVSCPTLAEAARHAQVTDRTLRRWLNNPSFREECERLRRAANEITHAELNGLSLKAAVVLGEALDDPNPNIRLRAALGSLSIAQKSNEIQELNQQIDRISAALPLWAAHQAARQPSS